jgi:hypothetical protein
MLKPVKAFAYQDHQAHITVHMAAMQDPKIQALLANNPMAPQLQQAMMAHVNEHIGYEYRVQISQQMGMPLPPQHDDEMGEEEDVNMTPEMEAQLAPMMAQAAQKLLMQNQQQAQAQAAAQQQQDPLIQIQQQELQLKAAEQQRKAKKDQDDFMIKQQQLNIEQERIKSNAMIAAGNAINQAGMNHAKLKSQRIQKGADMLGKASEKERQIAHERHTQMRDIAASQLDKHVDHAHNMEQAVLNHEMQKDIQASQPKTPEKKDTKE